MKLVKILSDSISSFYKCLDLKFYSFLMWSLLFEWRRPKKEFASTLHWSINMYLLRKRGIFHKIFNAFPVLILKGASKVIPLVYFYWNTTNPNMKIKIETNRSVFNTVCFIISSPKIRQSRWRCLFYAVCMSCWGVKQKCVLYWTLNSVW